MSDWDAGFDNGVEESPAEAEAPEREVKPVKLGRKGIALMITGLGIVLIILIFTLHSCTVEKRLNDTNTKESGKTAVVETNKPTPSGGSEATDFSENPAVIDVPASSGPVETTSKNNENPQGGNSNTGSGLQQVAEPSLSAVSEATGMVKSKKIYHIEASYMYCINIAMIAGDDTTDVYFYCGKKAYDAVYPGQSVKVSYQVDSEGNISVYAVKTN